MTSAQGMSPGDAHDESAASQLLELIEKAAGSPVPMRLRATCLQICRDAEKSVLLKMLDYQCSEVARLVVGHAQGGRYGN